MNLLFQLSYTFFKIGLFSIGGGYAVIALMQEQVVEQQGWLTEQAFTDMITISQMTPGPIAVNTSTFTGLQIAGIPGALAATVSCVSAGIVLSVLLHRFFQKHQQSLYAFEVLRGLKASSLGLIISAAATILTLTFFGAEKQLQISRINIRAAAIFLVTLVVLRKWKCNPILLMLLAGIAGIFLYAQ